LPLAGGPFDQDPTASILFGPNRITTACEVCVFPVLDPDFDSVDTDSKRNRTCVALAECDLAAIYAPPQVPRVLELTITASPMPQIEIAGTHQLLLGNCSNSAGLREGEFRCTGGGVQFRQSVSIVYDLCQRTLTISRYYDGTNCGDSSLSISHDETAVYVASAALPIDLREPLVLDLVSATLRTFGSTYGGGQVTTQDVTSAWAGVLPTLTLEPVT
jgi:hypothetical protein